MKTLVFKSLVLVFFLTINSAISAEIINGNGVVSTYTYEVPTFSKLMVDGNFDVVLTYGIQTSVTVKTDENLQKEVLIDTDGTTLFVRTKESVGNASAMTLYITVGNLRQIGFKDVLSVKTSEALWFTNLDLTLNTLGNTSIHLAAQKLNATIEGAGDLHLSGMVDELNVDNQGVGSLYTTDLRTKKMTIQSKSNRNIEIKALEEKTEIKSLPVNTPVFPKA
jgi:hypothetical protein